jgi:ketosteroid isomerase-like protein
MTVAMPLSEAARTLQALVHNARVTKHETVLTEYGEDVAVIVPIPPKRSAEERLKHLEDLMEWWESTTTEEEREAFARDIESGRETIDQRIPDRWE